MSERSWADLNAESDRVIDQAMAEAAARTDCICGAVDVPGASCLEWCDSRLDVTGPAGVVAEERE